MSRSRVAQGLQLGMPIQGTAPLMDFDDEKAQLRQEIAQLRLRILELERAADTDPLVSVYNRRAFMRELGRAQAVNVRYDIPSSVIFIDLNGFKSVNDRFGHGIGDDLLQAIGKALSAAVRQCDMVARLGGDEFGVILFKTTPGMAKAKAEMLRRHISDQQIETPGGLARVDASWGVAPCDPNNTPLQILDKADRAMYVAKPS